MKLRNLMYATMIACAFASCSKDDEVINGGETAKGTASLDVKYSVPQTKSIGTADDEDAVSDVVVYVFQENKLVGMSTGAGQGNATTSRKVSGLKGAAAQVLVLANCNGKLLNADGTSLTPTTTGSTTTLDQLTGAYTKIINETKGSLSMNSQLYSVNLTAGVTNYLGYAATSLSTGDINLNSQVTNLNDSPVYLYHNVAKVVLSSVTVDANITNYPNAKLTISKVFMLHGASNSMAVGKDATSWGATNVSNTSWSNGVANGDAANPADGTYQKFIETMKLNVNKDKSLFYYLATTETCSKLDNYISSLSQEVTNNQKYEGTANEMFYAYENPNNTKTSLQTLLVVEGAFSYGSGSNVVSSTRYYTVAIGNAEQLTTGSVYLGENKYQLSNGESRTAYGVVRNIQYNIALTVKGPGYTTPFGPSQIDNTFLDTQVKVVPFGTVDQSTAIE